VKPCFLVAFPQCTGRTSIPLIKERIRPRTTIISDEWRTYNRLSTEDCTRLRMIHPLKFVER
jgi:hypothetical protein